MSESSHRSHGAVITDIRDLHRKRGEVWLERQPERYLDFYWDDAVLFIFDHRMTIADMRGWLVPLIAVGGGPLTLELPEADDIIVSESGDAATTNFRWKTRSRNAEGIVFDRINFETDIWYRRNGVWKVICLHLTNLASDRGG